jgi:hypothetical protein
MGYKYDFPSSHDTQKFSSVTSAHWCPWTTMPQIIGRALDLIKTIKTGDPVLNLDRSVAAENLWPAALEKETDKAASILRSFFIDGFIVPYRTLGTCPHQVRR